MLGRKNAGWFRVVLFKKNRVGPVWVESSNANKTIFKFMIAASINADKTADLNKIGVKNMSVNAK